METCKYTGKNSYNSERDAWDATLKSLGKNVSALRVYKCNWCYKWHLTSKVTRKKK